MEEKVSGYPMLESQVKKALGELKKRNYGNAEQILEDALKYTRETYIVTKGKTNKRYQ